MGGEGACLAPARSIRQASAEAPLEMTEHHRSPVGPVASSCFTDLSGIASVPGDVVYGFVEQGEELLPSAPGRAPPNGSNHRDRK